MIRRPSDFTLDITLPDIRHALGRETSWGLQKLLLEEHASR
jgi:hypothetical protein